MKKIFTLTNDHHKTPRRVDDSYYCENPKNHNEGFRLCVNALAQLFPSIKGKDTITVILSTVRQHRKGETTAEYVRRNSGIPYIWIKGERVQLLEQTVQNCHLPITIGMKIYVQIF